MPRLQRVYAALLLTLALMVIAGSAAAHEPAATAPPLTAQASALIPVLGAAPAPPALPWQVSAVLVLGAIATIGRPRRALVVTLALLLCVFAFENALHSVHHGFDAQQHEECTVAAAAAHLAAIQVDDVGLSSVVLATIGRAEAAPPTAALTRSLSPDQGRAPPSARL